MTTAPSKNSSTAATKKQSSAAPIAGETIIGEGILEKIAGLAASEVDGVHSLGKSGLRGAVANFTGAVTGSAQSDRGVKADFGKEEASFDVEVIVDYGTNFPSVARAIRDRIAERIAEMTDLKTVEVNVLIFDIHFETEPVVAEPESTGRRLQ